MIASIHIHSYLSERYPDVAEEVLDKFRSMKCNPKVIRSVYNKAAEMMEERWEIQVVTIAASLLLCSPETILVNSAVRRSSGVATATGKVLGISQVSVSKKVDRARHYYTHVAWCRDAVDKIVKEVRGE